jgi:hypothetical protein
MVAQLADDPAEHNLALQALAYATAGFPVFPCTGKQPLTAHGFKDASTDAAQVRRWWQTYPQANIAFATGVMFWVLDVDPRHDGDVALVELERAHGPLPDTVHVLTGNGGTHYYFAADARIRCSSGSLPPGLDVRGSGGYVIAPPSIHPETGRLYRFEIGAALDDIPQAAGPAWLTNLILNGKSHETTGSTETAPIPQGRRHRTLLHHAGKLRWFGYDTTEIAGLLRAMNAARCQPQLADDEVVKLAADVARRYGPGVKAAGRQTAPDIDEDVDDRTADSESEPPETRASRPWPAPLEPEAFHGLAGDLVRVIAPETEADAVALLLQTLIAFGNAVGRTGSLRIEGDLHYPNLFGVLVGKTSKGRKGTAWGQVKRFVALADPDWMKTRVVSGLSSGEGLIWEVRDPIKKLEKAPRKHGEPLSYEEVLVDAGSADKRAFVLEPEFATVLRRIEREGNSLSGIMRLAWDTGYLRTLTKTSPITATDAHISVVGHVTAAELLRYLPRTELANGFANRILFACVQRSKLLPRGGRFPDVHLLPLARRLTAAIEHAQHASQLTVSMHAWEVWEAVYPVLSAERPGLVGAMLSRAEAQTMRLALVYALLDGSQVVEPVHFLAALAVWQYCEASVEYVFGDAVGDPVADELLRALRHAGTAGLSRTEIHDLFNRNRAATEIGRALGALLEQGLAKPAKVATGGRSAERWTATSYEENEGNERRGAQDELNSFRSFSSYLVVAREVIQRQGVEREPGGEG